MSSHAERSRYGLMATEAKMRPDLTCIPRQHGGALYWVVHDPVAGRHFLLRDEEYFVLRSLDGFTNVASIVERFAAKYAPRQLPTAVAWEFVTRLYRDGLVVSPRSGVGRHLLARSRAIIQQRRLAWWANPLFLRLPGFNPTRYFLAADRFTRYLFHPAALLAYLLLVITAAALVMFHWNDLAGRFPAFHELFARQNVVLYLITFGLLKVLHECGHGMTCIRLGGHIRELGVRLMCGMPCLYCDVSESWLIPRRRDRAAIAVAGIVVELIVASLACLVWSSTTPGPVNAVARAIMLVGSVSTILINGNPLMRLDGYFLLSDLLDIPNLWSRSREFWKRLGQRYLLGITVELADGDPKANNLVLACYGIASTAYHYCVMCGLIWLTVGVLRMMQLDLLIPVVVAGALALLIAVPLYRFVRWLLHPMHRTEIQPIPLAIKGFLVVLLGFFLVRAPLPYRVTAETVINTCDVHPVYVREPGSMISAVAAGTVVQSGEVLGRLENPDLQRELAAALGARDQQRSEVARLDVLRSRDNSSQIRNDRMVALGQLEVLERKCAELEDRAAHLTLVAPQSGVVISPPLRPRDIESSKLPPWSGSPLDIWNQQAWMQTDTLVCTVGKPDQLEAWIHVDETEIGFVAPGQIVHIYVSGMGGTRLCGTVTEVSEVGTKHRSDQADKAMPETNSWWRPKSFRRPVQRFHQVRVTIDSQGHPLLAGMQGRAAIAVPGRSLYERIVGYWRNNVWFAG